MITNKRFTLFLTLVLFIVSLLAQEAPETYKNPILPGFHPDPSICRVSDDYYLVNSTFEWFPGLPVYHSKDLVNWELIGYGVDRPEQLKLGDGLGDSRGVFAPTIRFFEGTYYIINTCVDCGGNFYITATNPAGPWSDPIWLDAPGIDPSLFWDDDGRCYYIGHGNLDENDEQNRQWGVWMQELDTKRGTLKGERAQLTYGHAINAIWTEGPHLYKIQGTYLLMVAEGGTEYNHSVTFHCSDKLWGPYVPNQVNPAITHRHLGMGYPVYAVGHADLVETQNGDWWSVMLAKRRVDGYTPLARETFMTPVKMENHSGALTPIYNPGIGRLETEQKRPDLPWSPVPEIPARDNFNTQELALQWNFLRVPLEKWHSVGEDGLSLHLRPQVADSLVNPSMVARRIQHHQFEAATNLLFSSKKENEQSGLIIYRNSQCHYQLLREKKEIVLIKTRLGVREEVARLPWEKKEVVLTAKADGIKLTFGYGISLENQRPIGALQSMDVVSDEVAGQFNGSYVGMYATSNGKQSKSYATFSWFEYRGE
jgi:xylan 1,4-beta-xylosidase